MFFQAEPHPPVPDSLLFAAVMSPTDAPDNHNGLDTNPWCTARSDTQTPCWPHLRRNRSAVSLWFVLPLFTNVLHDDLKTVCMHVHETKPAVVNTIVIYSTSIFSLCSPVSSKKSWWDSFSSPGLEYLSTALREIFHHLHITCNWLIQLTIACTDKNAACTF